MEFEIPAPPKGVHPNARGHWVAKFRATRSYRDTVGQIVRAEVMRAGLERPLTTATVACLFIVKTHRKRDRDNALASLKAAFDAMQDGGLIANDHGLTHAPVEFEVDREKAAFGPRVWVEVEGSWA